MSVLFMMPQWHAVSEGWMHQMIANISEYIIAIAVTNTKGEDAWQDTIPAYSLFPETKSIRYLSKFSKAFNLSVRKIPPKGDEYLISLIHKLPIDKIFCQYGTYAVRFMDVWEKTELPLYIHFHGYDAEFDLREDSNPEKFIHSCDYLKKIKELQHRAIFITNSHAAKTKLVNAGILPERIIVKYYGIPLPNHKHEHTKKNFIKILHLGRLVDCKSPDRTIKAFEIAKSEGLDGELIIAGDGPLKSMCELLRLRSPYQDSITLMGAVSNKTAQELYLEADVFTQHNITGEISYQTESLGSSILEAMAAALPIVGTKNGGVQETVVDDETGYLNDPGDIEAQAQSFLELGENPNLRQKMGKAGRKRVAEYFSPEREREALIRIMDLE